MSTSRVKPDWLPRVTSAYVCHTPPFGYGASRATGEPAPGGGGEGGTGGGGLCAAAEEDAATVRVRTRCTAWSAVEVTGQGSQAAARSVGTSERTIAWLRAQ